MSTTRRTLLCGLGAMPMVATGTATALEFRPALAGPDPIIGLHHEALALIDAVITAEDDDQAEPFWRRFVEIERQAACMKPVTLAGVVSLLEWARRVHVQFALDEGQVTNPDASDALVLSALDGALGVLRGMAGGRT